MSRSRLGRYYDPTRLQLNTRASRWDCGLFRKAIGYVLAVLVWCRWHDVRTPPVSCVPAEALNSNRTE